MTGFTIGWLGRRLKNLYNKPLFITLHSSVSAYPDGILSKLFMKKTLQSANKIITVSESIKKLISKFGINNSKIFVWGNGVDTNKFFQMNKIECRERLNLPMKSKILLNIGALTPIKGHRLLICAFSELVQSLANDLFLVIIGSGELENELKKLTKTKNMEQNILFTGSISHHEIPLWLNASDLFILSSYSEGNPVSLIEALSCGKPVIAPKIGSIPEIVHSDKYGLLFETGNINSLIKSIQRSLAISWDEQEIAKYGQKFSWESVVSFLLKQYIETLQEKEQNKDGNFTSNIV